MRSRTPEEQAEIERLVHLVSQARALRRQIEQVGYTGRVIALYHRALRREKRLRQKLLDRALALMEVTDA